MLLQGAFAESCCRVLQQSPVAGCCSRVLLQGAAAARDSELCRVLLQGAVARCCRRRDSELRRVLLQGAVAGRCCRPRLRVAQGAVAGVFRRAESRHRRLPAVFPESVLLAIISRWRSHLRGGALSKSTRTSALRGGGSSKSTETPASELPEHSVVRTILAALPGGVAWYWNGHL